MNKHHVGHQTVNLNIFCSSGKYTRSPLTMSIDNCDALSSKNKVETQKAMAFVLWCLRATSGINLANIVTSRSINR